MAAAVKVLWAPNPGEGFLANKAVLRSNGERRHELLVLIKRNTYHCRNFKAATFRVQSLSDSNTNYHFV
jgi:hypothetical protein